MDPLPRSLGSHPYNADAMLRIGTSCRAYLERFDLQDAHGGDPTDAFVKLVEARLREKLQPKRLARAAHADASSPRVPSPGFPSTFYQ